MYEGITNEKHKCAICGRVAYDYLAERVGGIEITMFVCHLCYADMEERKEEEDKRFRNNAKKAIREFKKGMGL